MDPVEVVEIAEPDLDVPAMIEGLPGVGHVGKLAAEHLIEEFDGVLVRRIHSEHFPPHVSVGDDGVASLACAELYAVEAGGVDLLVLAGNYQAVDAAGHYRLTEGFLDTAEALGATEVIALGGAPTGELVDEYTVIGAVTDRDHRDRFEAAGVEFPPGEPAGGIVGTSGLLLGLGARRGMPSACLMGETSGYLVDPMSARAVLEVLERVLGFEVDMATLEERAEEMEEIVRQIRERGTEQGTGDEDLRYIG